MSTPAAAKSTVFILGGGGNTGLFVVNGLLESGKFNVIVLTRPKSERKRSIQALKQKGVEIRFGDLSKASIPELEDLLKGVTIVLSLINVAVLEEQKKVFQAAKNIGVERVVPSEFAIPCPPGRNLHLIDKKLALRSYIKELGVGYTIIDVGWWMELVLPYPSSQRGITADLTHTFIGSGDIKTAVTCRRDIGRFVARILADPRTLNSYVFCHAEEVTQAEVYRVGEEASGKNFNTVKKQLSANDLAELILQERNNTSETQINFKLIPLEYLNSLFVLGDNTLQCAKKLGALDARALYPDFKPITLKEYAAEFYQNLPEIEYGIQ